MLLWSAVSLLPDADVIGFAWGIRYGDPWGHRGATHSFAFAVLVGIAAGLLASAARLPPLRTALTASLVLASHPLLDILTEIEGNISYEDIVKLARQIKAGADDSGQNLYKIWRKMVLDTLGIDPDKPSTPEKKDEKKDK